MFFFVDFFFSSLLKITSDLSTVNLNKCKFLRNPFEYYVICYKTITHVILYIKHTKTIICCIILWGEMCLLSYTRVILLHTEVKTAFCSFLFTWYVGSINLI